MSLMRSNLRLLAPLTTASLVLLSTVSGQVPSIAPPQVVPQAGAPETPAQTPQVPAAGAHSLTKEDAEAWLDGFMPSALQRGDIAGGVVVMVKDGQTLLAKGYGFADAAARKPVDPQRTLFRPGSVSKLFTWTAVMQLVEQGMLDLDADVNGYLDYKIPPRKGHPVTLRNLLTHTAGFDETARSLIIADPKDVPSLEAALKRWVPPRVTDAGSTPAYSNYGAALAGYIVQRVSREPFDEYVERHLFTPLGMNQATFRQPLPERFKADMSNGYQLGSGEAKPFEIINVPPAGSLSASGSDMAPFMIAHLQKGVSQSGRILQEATAVQMHSTRAPAIPPLNPMLLGFYASDTNGHHIISHGGDTEWFHSDLNLWPDDGVGLFISVNSAGRDGAAHVVRAALFQQFCARYFPGPLPEGELDAGTRKAHAQTIAGRYTLSRRAHTTFLNVLNVLGEIPVAANGDGTISVAALKGADAQAKKFKEIAPFVWQNVAGGERLAAKVENGRVVRFGYDDYPFMVFEPVPWWWSSGWLLPLVVAALVALALTTLAWPITALVRRRYGVSYGLTGRDAKAHRLVRIASVLVLATMMGWVVIIGLISASLKWAGPSMDGWLIALRLLSGAAFFAGAIIAVWNMWVVLRSNRRKLAKVWSLTLAICFLSLLYFALVCHLPGYTANY